MTPQEIAESLSAEERVSLQNVCGFFGNCSVRLVGLNLVTTAATAKTGDKEARAVFVRTDLGHAVADLLGGE